MALSFDIFGMFEDFWESVTINGESVNGIVTKIDEEPVWGEDGYERNADYNVKVSQDDMSAAPEAGQVATVRSTDYRILEVNESAKQVYYEIVCGDRRNR